MNISKILFVGLGGAGQRHLRIFHSILGNSCSYFAYRSSAKKVPFLNPNFSVDNNSTLESRYDLKSFNSLDKALNERPDLVVISNPTSLHIDIAIKSAQKGISVFIEKPFACSLDRFNEFRELASNNNINFFISYQRRYHPLITKIKKLIDCNKIGKIISGAFFVSSFLPSWHPYEDFRELYAANADLGGGVLLTEIHEIDLTYFFFGLPKSVFCSGGNLGSYPMDVEDTAHLILRYEKFSIQLCISFIKRLPKRSFFLEGTEGAIDLDLFLNKMVTYNYTENEITKEEDFLTNFSTDDLFQLQAKSFLFNNISLDENLKTAFGSLKIVEAAKISMQDRREIDIT
ncbi:MAG: Gfo/Idh/MocA family oxidoreductase [Oligoflexia bacterium]|nr:Gfo/Idh/MocA family oxidoreductase [Oligoflexia bacterium]